MGYTHRRRGGLLHLRKMRAELILFSFLLETILSRCKDYSRKVQFLWTKKRASGGQNLAILGSFMWLILEWPQVHHTDTAEKVLTDELAPAKPVGNRQQKRGKEGKHDGETNV